jgi:selenocysteine lyase/cysteine desulfurase
MSSRRDFLLKAGLSTGAFMIPAVFEPMWSKGLERQLEKVHGVSPNLVAADEDFWNWVRVNYSINPNLINLNNGGVSPQPLPVQETHIRFYKHANEGPSYFMWREMDKGREPLRKRLAEIAEVDAEEVAINRNATEGLNSIIFGLNLKAGDEVVLCKYDYPNMINAWKQREKRDGIKLVWIDLNLPAENETEIVNAYTTAFTDKTKIVHITHMINWTGQIVPVRKIADKAHAKNIEVLCDSAHTFGHFQYTVPELGCDYWATSLHKWMCAPFGTGMMWIRKEKIPGVWALLSAPEPDGKDIRKFESLGTRSFAAEMAAASALDFHQLIGGARKEARLRYLKNYWLDKVSKIPGIIKFTSTLPAFSCALANVGIEGVTPEEIERKLLDRYRIHCVAINWEKVNGVRITPNVYTSLQDLDLLVKGLTEIAQERK